MAKFKVGDRIERICDARKWAPIGYTTTVQEGGTYVDKFGEKTLYMESQWKLAPNSPIRTVTRREIVPGEYGVVSVRDRAGSVYVHCAPTAEELREAARVFTEIADVLEDKES